MPQSKNRKQHKQKLKQFKQNNKHMQKQQVPQMPPVRSIPVWPSDAKIELTGYEWEGIQNSLANLQIAQQVAQSVMSRNILNGTITMDFEKLNSESLQYEPMTEEEKVSHVEAFKASVEAFKAQQAAAKEAALTPTAAPEEKEPEAATEAKIIQMPS